VRKALKGQVAHICVHEQMTTVMPNAYGKVSFGDGKFTNRLDIVKALVANVDRTGRICLNHGALTNEMIRVWVEEFANAHPCVNLDARLSIALGTKEALIEQARSEGLDDLCVLQIDQATGRIGEISGRDSFGPFSNQRAAMFYVGAAARYELLEALLGKDDEDVMAVDRSLVSVVYPTWFKSLSCVIIGDDDAPLYVIADDARVNGKLMQHFEGWVQNGERLHLILDKEKHQQDGGVRFLLKKPLSSNGQAERLGKGIQRGPDRSSAGVTSGEASRDTAYGKRVRRVHTP